MTFITVADVRRASGAPIQIVSNTDVESIITIVEAETARKMNTKFTPTRRIDIMDGTGNNRIFTEKNPVLKILSINSDNNVITPDMVDVSRSSGMVRLNQASDQNNFIGIQNGVRIQYLFGYLVADDDNRTTTNGAVIAGTDIVITVDDPGTIAVGDWVEITGMDGNQEVAKVTVVSTNNLTVDLLNFAHEDESILYKIDIPITIKRFMELEAAIYIGLKAVGETYTFNASYSIADLSVVKGVPYTHWRETIIKNVQEREALRKIIKPRISLLVN